MRKIRLRNQILLYFLIPIVIPIVLIGILSFGIVSNIIINNSRESTYRLVKNINHNLDSSLVNIQEKSEVLNLDPTLFSIFNRATKPDEVELLKMDRDLNKVLSNYFSSKEIYSYHIVTNNFTFGSSRMSLPSGDFNKTSLYSIAMSGKGKAEWVPSYRYAEMFNQPELDHISLDYGQIFSLVRVVTPIYVDNGNIQYLNNKEYHILVLNFKDTMFQEAYKSNLIIPGSYYQVISSDGKLISSSYEGQDKTLPVDGWIDEARMKKSSTSIIQIKGRKMLLCYDTSSVNGWITAIFVPLNELLAGLNRIRMYCLFLCVLLAVSAMLIAYLLSNKITSPLKRLVAVIHKIGDGHFSVQIPLAGSLEMSYLTNKMNQLGSKIEQLIEENYKVKLREKETEIMALNLQLNPHFLFNTLNTIHWMAIDKGQKNISKMIVSLSSILKYALQNKSDTVVFSKDLEWLKHYTYILLSRFPGKFDMIYEIPLELNAIRVPKMFLQPFIENAILHGFERMSSGGQINIRGSRVDEDVIFMIEDNGVGIDRGKIAQLLGRNDEHHIGIGNVNKRIKLIFGSNYGVRIESVEHQGTKIYITLPANNYN